MFIRHFVIVVSLLSSLISAAANAMLMDPIHETAESLGYQVLGEIEFRSGTAQPDPKQMQKNLSNLGELCPRTQAWDSSITSHTNFVVMAWSDHEFPSSRIKNLSIDKVSLAQTRAQKTAEFLRDHVRGNLSIEEVNMATRKPHLVRVAEHTANKESRTDIKSALELSGAAPTNAFAIGLFGEYSQASKAVIWVECFENLVKRRPNSAPQLSIAGGKFPRSSETILN